MDNTTIMILQEDREMFQQTVDNVHSQFVRAVAEGRKNAGLTREQIIEIADGRIFSGQQALEKGLIDRLGNLEDAIEQAGKLGGIVGKPKVIKQKRKKSLLELILGIEFKPRHQVEEFFNNGISLKYQLY